MTTIPAFGKPQKWQDLCPYGLVLWHCPASRLDPLSCAERDQWFVMPLDQTQVKVPMVDMSSIERLRQKHMDFFWLNHTLLLFMEVCLVFKNALDLPGEANRCEIGRLETAAHRIAPRVSDRLCHRIMNNAR